MKALRLSFVFLLVWQTVASEDYRYYKEVEKSYKFHETPFKWYVARSICEIEGGTLALPENFNEVSILMTLFNDQPASKLHGATTSNVMWLGLHDMFENGQYITLRGDPIKYFYNTWDDTNKNSDKSCVSLIKTGKLREVSCDESAFFVCEKSNSSVLRTFGDSRCKGRGYEFSKELGKCYKLHTAQKQWSHARDICYSEGGQLAVVRNMQEEMFMSEMFNETMNAMDRTNGGSRYSRRNYYNNDESNYALLGFHDIYQEGHFITVNDERLSSLGYEHWGSGRPENSRNKNCGSMTPGGHLKDVSCSTPAMFFCEGPKEESLVDIKMPPKSFLNGNESEIVVS